MSTSIVPVAIVGAGPTGLTAATLLAQYGIECVVLERWPGVYPQPRAVHLDGEVRRILTRLGVGEAFDATSRPALGLRLLDSVDHEVLAQFDRDPNGGSNGHVEANLFDQPVLEALLRDNLGRYPSVTMRGEVEVTGVIDEIDSVRVEYTDRSTGEPSSIRARYVLGCDGANSRVRDAIGTELREGSFRQRWLVVDIRTAADLGQWDGIQQVCDATHAATFMRIGDTRYRWEFRLDDGEKAADFQDIAQLLPRLRPWLDGVPLDALELVRVAEYTFRAALADRWRLGRIFILGDAAHLSPPFIGQGMGAGLRDAANLSWKLAAVLQGRLSDDILDTYEIERKPHAQAMIRLARTVGVVMSAGGRLGDRVRRGVGICARYMPLVSRLVASGETPALHRSALVDAPRRYRGAVGRLIPNPGLADGRRLDDLIAGRYAVVTDVPIDAALRRELESRHAVVVEATSSAILSRWLRGYGAGAVLVRPDGTIQQAGSESSALSRGVVRLDRPARV
ncbi:bifunctional 3-(3-hydroxy-phenyl)propionate/3-hydroxycinnamic acid hydroxylase [Nocardia sp. NPDC060259]|uniref:bifunctional 3-(3-hydroxy-phenyl)propionate/3-hydroxycinnamic acid hydroxylase MhpA n=1 Tax=Nocardia sp. NPDC060259 TaxID=3347088 RepID=UPI00366881D2